MKLHFIFRFNNILIIILEVQKMKVCGYMYLSLIFKLLVHEESGNRFEKTKIPIVRRYGVLFKD